MIDASYLITKWNEINEALSPSIHLYSESEQEELGLTAAPKVDDTIDRIVSELSVLSSRRNIWEASVCLVHYAEEVPQAAYPRIVRQASAILDDLDFQFLLNDPTLWSSQPYFKHCKTLTESPLNSIVPATYVLKLCFREAIVFNRLGVLETFQECYRKHHPDWTKIRECMRSKETEHP